MVVVTAFGTLSVSLFLADNGLAAAVSSESLLKVLEKLGQIDNDERNASDDGLIELAHDEQVDKVCCDGEEGPPPGVFLKMEGSVTDGDLLPPASL